MTEPRIYLRSIHLERFGRFHDTVVGPFSDRMNIVLGANEAGKTTVASFVGGVLFGWEEARGNRNTYMPEPAVSNFAVVSVVLRSERSSSLFRENIVR